MPALALEGPSPATPDCVLFHRTLGDRLAMLFSVLLGKKLEHACTRQWRMSQT